MKTEYVRLLVGLAMIVGCATWVWAREIVVSGCDHHVQHVAELVVDVDDEALADYPQIEDVVKTASFRAISETDFPGPNSYDAFVDALRPLPAFLQQDILDAVHLRYPGPACR